MASLISSKSHISDAVNNADSYRVLRGRVSVLKNTLDARLMPCLELAGFESVAQIRYTVLRFDLLSALVERWRPETHTFHFPCGECTVTLEDVALQLGLPIDGSPVTGLSAFTDPDALCYQLLGDSPGDGESYFSGVQFTWLKAKYGQLSAIATEGELMCAARAYIMHIIGGEIMPDASNDKLGLSRASSLVSRALSGDRSESLRHWRMPLTAVVLGAVSDAIFGIGGVVVRHRQSDNVPLYRLIIEQYVRDGFIWTPYRTPEITAVVPSSQTQHSTYGALTHQL
ncbi:protein MAINTENANCE OF MERISTEMS-like [Gossypium raimondii]|uniref:protein MAINTENANCE OF MERISTEMS-like n=1 Tax=Gossypium raimondii TaxID=29730 RepID=UPI00227A33A3|nr:protein MAINTENANCE OF MERISTEMS-like [Gossypium raimondii]